MMTKPSPLRVLFMASEADPFVKIGGLGDVAGSLPIAIRQLPNENIDIRLVIPYHGVISRNLSVNHVASFDVAHSSRPYRTEVFQTEQNGMPVYLVSGQPIPPSGPVYSEDLSFDAHKFTFFSLAALELASALGWQPHIIHANDWHTAAAIYAISLRREKELFFKDVKTILSVHNLPYLGMGSAIPLGAFGLPPAIGMRLPDWATHVSLPLGLLAADRIVAVSPTYAHEILTPEFGSGLHSFLRSRQQAISGILNGIDIQRWDPATDIHIKARFSLEDFAPRNQNKIALQQEFRLPAQETTPLLVMITRMDYQKGVDIAIEALRQLTDLRWQAILLGTGQFELEAACRSLEQDFPDRVRAAIRFDASLSRRMYAGADMILIPSRYEPCGLTQMIGMRYGCVPVARATGGLRDTIEDGEQGNGFLFANAAAQSLADTLRRAINIHIRQGQWEAMQRRGMSQDFSWQRSAIEYVKLYHDLIPTPKEDKI